MRTTLKTKVEEFLARGESLGLNSLITKELGNLADVRGLLVNLGDILNRPESATDKSSIPKWWSQSGPIKDLTKHLSVLLIEKAAALRQLAGLEKPSFTRSFAKDLLSLTELSASDKAIAKTFSDLLLCYLDLHVIMKESLKIVVSDLMLSDIEEDLDRDTALSMIEERWKQNDPSESEVAVDVSSDLECLVSKSAHVQKALTLKLETLNRKMEDLTKIVNEMKEKERIFRVTRGLGPNDPIDNTAALERLQEAIETAKDSSLRIWKFMSVNQESAKKAYQIDNPTIQSELMLIIKLLTRIGDNYDSDSNLYSCYSTLLNCQTVLLSGCSNDELQRVAELIRRVQRQLAGFELESLMQDEKDWRTADLPQIVKDLLDDFELPNQPLA